MSPEVVVVGFGVASVHHVGVAAHKLQLHVLLFEQVGVWLDRIWIASNAALQSDV